MTSASDSFTFNFCSINPNVREGLLEVFYGVYEKDPDKVFNISVRTSPSPVEYSDLLDS